MSCGHRGQHVGLAYSILFLSSFSAVCHGQLCISLSSLPFISLGYLGPLGFLEHLIILASSFSISFFSFLFFFSSSILFLLFLLKACIIFVGHDLKLSFICFFLSFFFPFSFFLLNGVYFWLGYLLENLLACTVCSLACSIRKISLLMFVLVYMISTCLFFYFFYFGVWVLSKFLRLL